jgi:serine/threonine-protein kinase
VGVIHRDIKPANIILCARGSTLDVAKVVDFGLVKHVGGAGDRDTMPAALVANDTAAGEEADAPISSGVLSRTGTVLGTPMYLSPEAMRDPAAVDGRADLYALGAVAYFLLTGTTVFGGATVMEACRHHLFTKPDPPSQRLREKHPDSRATIPADLEAIVLKLLAKNPENRIQSAGELVAELEASSAAGTWSNDDARAWWAHSGKSDAAAGAKSEETSWSAKTIAVDLAR